jgi:hypothetical protein
MQVVPITDASVRLKIHQTYRIGYLKDVVLARVLDDATFNTLSSLVLFNNVEVVLALQVRVECTIRRMAPFSRLSPAAWPPARGERACCAVRQREVCDLGASLSWGCTERAALLPPTVCRASAARPQRCQVARPRRLLAGARQLRLKP